MIYFPELCIKMERLQEELSAFTNVQLKGLLKQYDISDSDIGSVLKKERIKHLKVILYNEILNNIVIYDDILFQIMLNLDANTIKSMCLMSKNTMSTSIFG